MAGLRLVKLINTDQVAKYLCRQISEALVAGQKVLWLVPGGSSIKIAVRVSQWLKGNDLTNLTVTLTDERFGEVGHADSNWQQLLEGGLELPGAKLQPVLSGADMDETTGRFNDFLSEQLDAADYRIGFFGIGADGHTAGILPGSSAVSADAIAAGYDAGQYKRITITPQAIVRLDEAVVYVAGEEKRRVLDNLAEELPLDKQPAQVLKKVNKLSIFNDLKGEAE